MLLRQTSALGRCRHLPLATRQPSALLSTVSSFVASSDSQATTSLKAAAQQSDSDKDHSSNYQLVIVGTGWAGYQMFTNCKKHRVDIELTVGRPVDIVVVSKRNVRSLRQGNGYVSMTVLVLANS